MYVYSIMIATAYLTPTFLSCDFSKESRSDMAGGNAADYQAAGESKSPWLQQRAGGERRHRPQQHRQHVLHELGHPVRQQHTTTHPVFPQRSTSIRAEQVRLLPTICCLPSAAYRLLVAVCWWPSAACRLLVALCWWPSAGSCLLPADTSLCHQPLTDMVCL